MINSKTLLNDRYQLEEKLSEFSNRQTWRATDLKAEQEIYRQVIIKILIFSPQMNWEQLKLFEREALVLKNINHPKIPKYLDSFYRESSLDLEFPSLILVQELICGLSLKAILDKNKGFSTKEVKQYAKQLLNILIYLHELSPPILHRDIKPSNVILGDDQTIYLVDFGAVQDKAKAEGATFTVVGSSGYTPPEQLWGKAIPASDLYALGATLIHLLTGKSPAELPQRKMQIDFHSKVHGRDPEFIRWLERLVNPATERRFSTAQEALTALQESQNILTPKLKLTEKVSPNYIFLCLVFLVGFVLPIYLVINLLDSLQNPSKNRNTPPNIERNW
ncbi:serine/threonine protein kinase [Laspinema sp. A4]|uniref:serine/threonine protein kinase n=1 Tax=Laspinema sp. D2d TaxID=2953686 RepID=UPI0021BA9C2A|nr:serine/threonine-protein kinase [Laspinema sp. D2d]MCT7984240.1 serine/threonine protein kinase [Laspinema sp. D2d]